MGWVALAFRQCNGLVPSRVPCSTLAWACCPRNTGETPVAPRPMRHIPTKDRMNAVTTNRPFSQSPPPCPPVIVMSQPPRRLIPFALLVAGWFAAAAMATGGRVTLSKCDPSHLTAVIDSLRSCGAKITIGTDTVDVEGPDRVEPIHVVTHEYPGFPTDMQAQIIAMLCLADGVSTVKETIYTDRFTHVPELRRFGAEIRLDGNLAVIKGVGEIQGAPVMATDIRASSALILAAMRAQGRTEVRRVF